MNEIDREMQKERFLIGPLNDINLLIGYLERLAVEETTGELRIQLRSGRIMEVRTHSVRKIGEMEIYRNGSGLWIDADDRS